MKIAYFDTIAGISGDMMLGAFVSAGVSLDNLTTEIGKLNLDGVELESTHVERNGIAAVKIDVVISRQQQQHRNIRDILSVIDASSLSNRVKETAKKIFGEVARAEAKVHNTAVERVHFHEVGALDSIIDIVGTAICLEQLGIESVYSSPVKLGSGGFVETEHGRLPIPGPATIEILKNYPAVLTDIPFELTTPTGAAIVKALSLGVLSTEQIKIESIGYGAGSREISQVPNLLRVLVGRLASIHEEDDLVIVETNIDDMNPEIYPFVIERLLELGALDAYLTPTIMKKGRPGVLLSVLASRSQLEDVVGIILAETTTLGVRIYHVERKKLTRTVRKVETVFGRTEVKVVVHDGRERLIPEFEECRRLAKEKNMSLLDVYRALERELGG